MSFIESSAQLRLIVLTVVAVAIFSACKSSAPPPSSETSEDASSAVDVASEVDEAQKPEPARPEAPSVVGSWTSVRFEGAGCAPMLKGLDINLSADKSFDLVARLEQNGEAKTDTQKGTWSIEGRTITLQTERGALVSEFAFEGELLTIEEKGRGCREFYRRRP